MSEKLRAKDLRNLLVRLAVLKTTAKNTKNTEAMVNPDYIVEFCNEVAIWAEMLLDDLENKNK